MSTKLTSVTATGQFSSLAIANELEDRGGLYTYTCNLTFAIILYKALFLNNRSRHYVCRHIFPMSVVLCACYNGIIISQFIIAELKLLQSCL